MPRNSRELAKRKVSSIVNKLDWSGSIMSELIEMYKEREDYISTAFEELQRLLLVVYEGVKKIDEGM